MMSHNKSRMLVGFVLTVLAPMGCSHFSGESRQSYHHAPYEQEPEAIVEVGGSVLNPGRIPVPEEGISLQRALALAGGSRQVTTPQTVVSQVILEEHVKTLSQRADLWGGLKFAADELFKRCPEQYSAVEQQRTLENLKEAEERLAKSRRVLLQEATVESVDRLQEASAAWGAAQAAANARCRPPGTSKRDFDKAVEEAKKERDNAIKGLVPLRTSQFLNAPAIQLVQIERAQDTGAERLFLTYDLASTGAAANLILRHGDFVQVLDVAATGLSTKPNLLQASNVVLGGFVRTPGTQSLGELSDFSSLGSQALSANLREPVWIVEQSSTSGLSKDVFVLPPSLVEDSAGLGALPLQPNARYTYTSALAIPPVAESAARSLVRPLLAERQERAEQRRERLKECLDQAEAETGDTGAKVLQTVRGIGQTIGTRLGLR